MNKISEHLEELLSYLKSELDNNNWDIPQQVQRHRYMREVEDAISETQYNEKKEAMNG